MAGKVFFVNNLTEPVLHHRAGDIIVIDPLLIAGIVRRVDIDTLYLASVSRQKCLEGRQIIAVDNQIVMQAGLAGNAFILFGDKLVVFYAQMVILNELPTLEI